MDGFCFLFVLRLMTFIQIFGFWVFVEIKWGRIEQSATAIKPPMTDGQGGYLKQTCTNRTVGITQLPNRSGEWSQRWGYECPVLRVSGTPASTAGSYHQRPNIEKYARYHQRPLGMHYRWVTPSRCWIVIAAEQKLLLRRSHCCQVISIASFESLIKLDNSKLGSTQ